MILLAAVIYFYVAVYVVQCSWHLPIARYKAVLLGAFWPASLCFVLLVAIGENLNWIRVGNGPGTIGKNYGVCWACRSKEKLENLTLVDPYTFCSKCNSKDFVQGLRDENERLKTAARVRGMELVAGEIAGKDDLIDAWRKTAVQYRDASREIGDQDRIDDEYQFAEELFADARKLEKSGTGILCFVCDEYGCICEADGES